MKKALIPALVLAMLAPTMSLAQENSATTSKESPSKDSRSDAKPHTVAGIVGIDGKTFLDTRHSRWTVANPAILSGFENQRVKVKYLLATDRSQLQIVSVKAIPQETQNTAFKMDSAFHR